MFFSFSRHALPNKARSASAPDALGRGASKIAGGSLFAPHGGGLSGLDPPVYPVPRRAASARIAGAGGVGVFGKFGGAGQRVGLHAESGASPREITDYATLDP